MPVELGSAYGQIILDASGVQKGSQQAQGILGGLESSMASIGSTLTTKVTLPLVGVGAAAGGMAVQMDAAMRNIQSVSKDTDEEIGALQDRFVELSTDLRVTTDDAVGLAEGFYEVQGSGFEGAEGMTVLLAATKAASAGLTSTEVAAGAVTAKLNAYGEGAEEAERTSDLMFRTVDRGVGTFEELSGSLSNVVGTAANAGVSFDVVSAALSTMSKQGQSFAEASTGLNQLILRLVDPSEELAEVLAGLGYESGQAALEQLGLVGTLEMLSDAGYDNTAALSPLLGNVRALRAALALTGEGSEMFAEDLAAMADAAGATEEAFAIQTQSAQAQLKNLANEAKAAGIEFGTILLPALQDGIGFVKELFEAFRNLPAPVQETIVKAGLLAAAAGPLLRIGSGLIGTAQTLVGGTRTLATTLPQLTAKLGVSAASMGAVALAAGAVVAAYLKWQDVQKTVEEGTKQTADAWDQFFQQQIEGGANAAEVLETYREKQALVRDELDKGGLAVDLLVRDQEALYTRTGELNVALAQAADTYAEYEAAAREAGVADEGLFSEATFERIRKGRGMVQDLTLGLLEAAEGFREQYAEAQAADQALLTYTNTVMGLKEAEEETQQAFQVTGETMQARADAMGVLNAMMEDQVEAEERAAAGMEAYREATEKAAEEAQKQLEITQQQNIALLEEAEALTGKSEKQIAGVALQNLEEMYKSGAISFEDYMTAAMEVQDTFGLVDEEGRALQQGLAAMNKTLAAGILPGDQYDDMLKAMIADAEDGVIAFGDLLTQIDAVNERFGGGEEGGFLDPSTGVTWSSRPSWMESGGEGLLPPDLVAALEAAGLGSLAATPEAAGGGPSYYDEAEGAWVHPEDGQGAGRQQLVIYGGLHLEGVQGVEDLLAQLQALAG